MEKLVVNETPVRTSRNFLINNINTTSIFETITLITLGNLKFKLTY